MFEGRVPPSRYVRVAAITLILLVAVAGTLALWSRVATHPAGAPFSAFVAALDADQVARVAIDGDALTVERRDGSAFRTIAPPGYVATSPAFVPAAVARGVRLEVVDGSGWGPADLGWLGAALLAVAGVGFVVHRRMYGVTRVGGASAVDARRVDVTFADVAGVDEARDEVREIVECLRDPARYAAIGGRVPRGILLVGPPGTGKTLLARSMAGEAGVPFLSASGSDFVEMFAGVGAARVRRLFKAARAHASCIVFIDELDAIGRRRGSTAMSHEEREHTLNQLLVEMDGFSQAHNVVVVAATNRADILDPALLRPGRFDRQVVVDRPDLGGREQILRLHARTVPLAGDVDLRQVARGTPGFSGADLATLVNEAALLAARAQRAHVVGADFEAARDKALMGAERPSVVMTDQERLVCAIHEAGHALVAALLPGADPLHKVTIIPRGRALGVTMQLPEADRHTHSRTFLKTQLATLMGGRVAERLVLGEITSGASNDIERATQLARSMVCELGMSPLGPLRFGESGSAGLSEATAQRVDDEITALVAAAHKTARELIETHRDALTRVAFALLAEESLDAAQVTALLAEPTPGAAPVGTTA